MGRKSESREDVQRPNTGASLGSAPGQQPAALEQTDDRPFSSQGPTAFPSVFFFFLRGGGWEAGIYSEKPALRGYEARVFGSPPKR